MSGPALPRLAVLGAEPAFAQPLHVGRPNVPDADAVLARVKHALDTRYLTAFGPYLREFERLTADVAGVRHCVAMCNATLALQVLARATGLTGEVIVPSFTFIASAHALHWEGITPVFCDIDETTGNIDPAHAERLITPRTTGILAVHLWGVPAPVDDLAALAERHGLTLLYDSAHAIGSSDRGRPVGGFGRAEVLSFHATKFVNSFEGGAVVTDDGGLAERLRAMHNYGRDDANEVRALGINGKLTEVAAAMGITSLEHIDALTAINREHHARYRDALADLPGVRLREGAPHQRLNHQYVVIEVDEHAGLSRDELVAVMQAERVLVRTHFDPGCHRSAPYAADPTRYAPLPLPHTEALSARVVSLPTGSAVNATEIERVCDLIRTALANGPAIRARLTADAARVRAGARAAAFGAAVS